MTFVISCTMLCSYSQNPCVDSVMNCQFQESVCRELKKTRFIMETVKKENVLKNDCNQKTPLNVFPIYWFVGDSEYLKEKRKVDSVFLTTLSFIPKDLNITNSSISKNPKDLLFQAILYDDCDSAILSYSEAKLFYGASVYDKLLFSIVKTNKIKCVFYIANFPDRKSLYFLVSSIGKIFVLPLYINSKDKVTLIPLDEYEVEYFNSRL